MKAYAIQKYKAPLVQVEAPEPEVGPEDVLVALEAASVNHVDARIAQGQFRAILPYQMPLVLGHDGVGTVVETGSAVTSPSVGETVYFKAPDLRIGTFAERIAVRADAVARAPRNLTAAQAAALPLVGLTAWQALFVSAGVGPGSRVMVQGGSGAVGSLAVQLAHQAGAHVAATAGARNVQRVRDLGADVVLDYSTQDASRELSGYDFLLATQSGKALLQDLGVLAPGGMALGIAGPPEPGFARRMGLNPVVRAAVGGLSWQVRRRARELGVDYRFTLAASDGAQLAELAARVEQGTLAPLPIREFGFAQTPEALAAAEDGGKVVVTMPATA